MVERRTLLERYKGMLRSFSIGFIARVGGQRMSRQGYENCYMKFTEIEWIETSVVDIPASPNALFDVKKSILSYGDFNKTGDCGKEVCSCSTDTTPLMIFLLMRNISLRLRNERTPIVIEFGKAEMDAPMEDEGQPEGESLYSLREEIAQLKETLVTLINPIGLIPMLMSQTL